MEQHTTEMLLSAIGALAAVVAYLFRQQTAHAEATDAKLADCEKDRLDLWRELANVQRQIDERNEAAD